MSQIIASTYEIMQEIGSGGGGVVYLAKHLRLGKWVVLKADKRTLSAKPEALRREVDALKNLSHTYIPQVYDFIVENGVVYTVMDYIEGESLDKPLKQGVRFSQATVVKWACQLLEALVYLHSRPPHGILHSDIKPANIMRTPQDDICLIDFNIALALGEEGAVRVGYSQGYASPEHYGTDFKRRRTVTAEEQTAPMTEEDMKTAVMGASQQMSGSTGGRSVLLDVRSDIYSLGATLYHLLTGIRPVQEADQVIPASEYEDISPAVAAILDKAMEPVPEDRWQSAAEMLRAFERLHADDPRVKRHWRRVGTTAVLLTAAFLLGGAMTFVGLKQLERQENAYVLAEYSANALAEGDAPRAVSYAMMAFPQKSGMFDPPDLSRAQKALTEALGVYDLTDGFKTHLSVALPSAPIKLALSPSGTRLGVLVSGEVYVFDTETGRTEAVLPAEKSALSEVVFADDDTLLYAGEGALRACDLASGKELWSGKAATGIAVSSDGETVAAVYRDENVAAVYHVETGEAIRAVTFHDKRQSVVGNDIFADPGDNLFEIDGSGRWLAVSFSDGSLRVFDLRNSENDLEIFDTSDFSHFEGGFYGQYFAFSATAAGQSVFAVIDMATMEQTGGFSGENPFHVRADESGIYVCTGQILVKLDPVTGEQTEAAYTESDITAFSTDGIHTVTAMANGAYAFYDSAARLLETHKNTGQSGFVQVAGAFAAAASLDAPSVRIMKLDSCADRQLFTYDSDFSHNEARVSADGRTVMLFRYDAFRLYDIGGEILTEVELPEAGQIHDQQYCREGQISYLEVIYRDGLTRRYSAETGALMSETQEELPDESLYEEFLTDHLRITAPLHGVPEAYDLDSGELVRELEQDDYLTYVTQVGPYVITEYINGQGERYGLLLDQNCRTLAELPDLCDITPDGTLIFDDQRGNLRTSQIYTLQELQALAQEQDLGR